MRINSGMQADITAQAIGTDKASGIARQTAEATECDGIDSTVLTEHQDAVSVLQAQANALPDQRQEKVDALRASIQNGEYQVSPEQIAAAMYRDMFSVQA